MAGRRGTTPLFELLSEDRASRSSTKTSVSDVASSASAESDPEPVRRITGIRISTRMLWLVIAASLFLLVGVWVGGVMTGRAQADAEWREAGLQPGSPREPVLGIKDPTLRGQSGGERDVPASQPASRPESASTARHPEPHSEVDPRTPGWNYLHLVTLDRAEAERVVAFLADEGVPALAVPVEDGRARANNTGPCRVFTLVGVPGGADYSKPGNQSLRERHEANLRRLGRIWQTERNGSANFDQPIWTKYQPGA